MNTEKSFNRKSSDNVFFYGSLAKKHGVRLSAFVCYLVQMTFGKRQRQKDPSEYDPAETFGKIIGVHARQMRNIAAKAQEEGYIKYHKTYNGTKYRITNKALYDTPKSDIFYYERELATAYGINAAIILTTLSYYTFGDQANRAPGLGGGYERLACMFPWMTSGGVRQTILKLRKLDLVRIEYKEGYATKTFFANEPILNRHLERERNDSFLLPVTDSRKAKNTDGGLTEERMNQLATEFQEVVNLPFGAYSSSRNGTEPEAVRSIRVQKHRSSIVSEYLGSNEKQMPFFRGDGLKSCPKIRQKSSLSC